MSVPNVRQAAPASARGCRTTLAISVVALIGLGVVHVAVARRFDFPRLVGDRSEAIFDLWSLQHFCAGILLGSILVRVRKFRLTAWGELALAALLLALLWEAAELAMEAGLAGPAVAGWKDGFEHWSNRLVGDPLMVTGGALVARRLPSAWKIVLVPAALWLAINVSSASSMSIQRLLFR